VLSRASYEGCSLTFQVLSFQAKRLYAHPKLAQKSCKPFKRPFGGPAPRPRPQRYDNGFLNLDNVPPQVAVAHTHNTRHPLLSVGGICSIIYDTLLADLAVEIYILPHPLGHDTIQKAHGRPISVDGINLNPHVSLFRTFPFLCRQSYNETSALNSSRVLFYFEFISKNFDRQTMNTWAESLLPYQHAAVKNRRAVLVPIIQAILPLSL
jgi:hypothetical protein